MEGDLVEHREVSAGDIGITAEITSGLHWYQIPDFAAIDHKKFQEYDLVVCAQPETMSKDPMGLLQSVHHLVKPGGLLVLGSQYDWVPTGNHAISKSRGDAVLANILEPWFDVAADPMNLSFTKAETARKFSCGSQHLTFWKRRDQERTSEISPSTGPAIADNTVQGQSMYDDQTVLGQYLDFHFGPCSDYPVACATHCIEVMREVGAPLGRALEVGGGPGRAGFELSKHFKHVDSGDYSQSFVDIAKQLVRDGKLEWSVASDMTAGVLTKRSIALEDLKAGSIEFSRMDAQALPASLSGYDLICGFNLIDRLARPKDFLTSLKDRLNPGGVLVLSSPYTWLEDFTPKEEWLGAFKYGDNDGPSTYMGLKEVLQSEGFEEVKAPQDVWFRIDELDNGRKSQQTRAQMTFWRRL
jgi:putative 4-mercaptohistidine N1-methyltranferase